MYDGTTGAVVYADRIELYLVDGQRGDDDLTANGVIVAPGAPGANASPWRNPARPEDVDRDEYVKALDVLRLINEINGRGTRELPPRPQDAIAAAPPYWDVTGDGWLTPEDVLKVINYLNTPAPAGEGESPESPDADNLIPNALTAPFDAATADRVFSTSAVREWSQPQRVDGPTPSGLPSDRVPVARSQSLRTEPAVQTLHREIPSELLTDEFFFRFEQEEPEGLAALLSVGR
jgi:hypothetical protein